MIVRTLAQWAATAFLAWAMIASSSQAQSEPRGCIAVFEFELMDHSLDGEVNGARPEQAIWLLNLTKQLRKWTDEATDRKSCGMEAVQREAAQSNLSACGCIPRLAKSVGADLAVVSSVHKVSNLILNIKVDIFETRNGTLLAQLNADIRSNTASSWERGLKWLIDHRLNGALAALEGRKT